MFVYAIIPDRGAVMCAIVHDRGRPASLASNQPLSPVEDHLGHPWVLSVRSSLIAAPRCSFVAELHAFRGGPPRPSMALFPQKPLRMQASRAGSASPQAVKMADSFRDADHANVP